MSEESGIAKSASGAAATQRDPTFLQWLLEQIRHTRVIALAVASILTAAAQLLSGVRSSAIGDDGRLVVAYASQALLILTIAGVIAFGPSPRMSSATRYKRGVAAVTQFWRWWPTLWFSWFFLYVLLAISVPILGGESSVFARESLGRYFVRAVLHAANNAPTLIVLMLFHLIAEPTLPEDRYPRDEARLFLEQPNDRAAGESKRASARDPIGQSWARFNFWVALFVLLFLAELFVIVGGELVFPRDAISNPHSSLRQSMRLAGMISGLAAGVATALFVGQLDSRLVRVPTWALVMLFGYAAIQPSFEFLLSFEPGFVVKATQASLVVAALLGKLLMFAVVQWLAMSDRLLYLMVYNATLDEQVDAHRAAFMREMQPRAAAESTANSGAPERAESPLDAV